MDIRRDLVIAILGISLLPLQPRAKTFDPNFESLVDRLIGDGQDSVRIIQIFQDERVTFIDALVPLNLNVKENLDAYRGFLNRNEIVDGLRFLQFWRKEFGLILEGTNIPPEIVVAILKVESNLGRRPGEYPVIAAFATISSLDHPRHWTHMSDGGKIPDGRTLRARAQKRSAWAYRELNDLLTVCDLQGWDPLELRGSWAGAFGWAQFLPSSYLRCARDGDGDQWVDPNNLLDAVASLVCYLTEAGWGRSARSQHRALLRYNPSSVYADCVLNYAQELKKLVESEEPAGGKTSGSSKQTSPP